ncbi:unnamed protein product [Spodoptera exigua]|nr:unnamed protein product [Spodoptera exigua]
MNTYTEQPPCRCEFVYDWVEKHQIYFDNPELTYNLNLNCSKPVMYSGEDQPAVTHCGAATIQRKKKAVNYRTTPLFYEPKLFKLDPAFFVEESEYSDEESEYFGEELEYSEEDSDTSEKESEPFEIQTESNDEKRGSSEEETVSSKEKIEYSKKESKSSKEEIQAFELEPQSLNEENQTFEEAYPYFGEEAISSAATFVQQPEYSEAGSSYLAHQAPYMSQQYYSQQPHFGLQTADMKPVPSYYGTQSQYYKPMPPYYAPMPLYYGPAAFQCGIVPGYNRHY